MTVKIDKTTNTIEQPEIFLCKRNKQKIGMIPFSNDLKIYVSTGSADEVSFTVHKNNNGVELDCWSEVESLKLVLVEGFGYFEIAVDEQLSNETTKVITGISLGEAELGQKMISQLSINGETDRINDDNWYTDTKDGVTALVYKDTVLFNSSDVSHSLIHRIMSFAPHWSIGYVASQITIKDQKYDTNTIVRSFEFSSTTVYDALTEVEKELDVIFIFNTVTRTVNMYDLNEIGEDTTIFVNRENLANSFSCSSNKDNIKNCFKVVGGDDNVNAAIRAINGNGSQYIYYFDDRQKTGMSSGLRQALNDYEALCETKQSQYQQACQDYYNALDAETEIYLTKSPTRTTTTTTATAELAKLANLTTSGITSNHLTQYGADKNVLTLAQITVDYRYTVKIEESTLTQNNSTYTWSGIFSVVNEEKPADKAIATTSQTITFTVNERDYYYTQMNAILGEKNLLDQPSVSELRTYISSYNLTTIKQYKEAFKQCVDTLTDAGYSVTTSPLYSFYKTYWDKWRACEEVYNTTLVAYDNAVKNTQNKYEIVQSLQQQMDFVSNLGNYYNEFCSFVREDVYENSNYISDGLDNSKLTQNAQTLIEVATKELVKSGTMQTIYTANLNNLFENPVFEPFYEHFDLFNWIHAEIDDEILGLRIIGITFDFSSSEQIEVEFSEEIKNADGTNRLQSILKNAKSMATSYSSTKQQAKNGKEASVEFTKLKNEGLNSALMNVKTANEEVTIDAKGINCKSMDQNGEYDNHQLRITGTNMVLTDDNWETARLAIGKMMYNGREIYGVVSDVLIGDMVVGNTLNIYNGDKTMSMDAEGLKLTNGTNTIIFDPSASKQMLMDLQKDGESIFYVNEYGDLYIDGHIYGGSLHLENDKGVYVDIDPSANNIVDIAKEDVPTKITLPWEKIDGISVNFYTFRGGGKYNYGSSISKLGCLKKGDSIFALFSWGLYEFTNGSWTFRMSIPSPYSNTYYYTHGADFIRQIDEDANNYIFIWMAQASNSAICQIMRYNTVTHNYVTLCTHANRGSAPFSQILDNDTKTIYGLPTDRGLNYSSTGSTITYIDSYASKLLLSNVYDDDSEIETIQNIDIVYENWEAINSNTTTFNRVKYSVFKLLVVNREVYGLKIKQNNGILSVELVKFTDFKNFNYTILTQITSFSTSEDFRSVYDYGAVQRFEIVYNNDLQTFYVFDRGEKEQRNYLTYYTYNLLSDTLIAFYDTKNPFVDNELGGFAFYYNKDIYFYNADSRFFKIPNYDYDTTVPSYSFTSPLSAAYHINGYKLVSHKNVLNRNIEELVTGKGFNESLTEGFIKIGTKIYSCNNLASRTLYSRGVSGGYSKSTYGSSKPSSLLSTKITIKSLDLNDNNADWNTEYITDYITSSTNGYPASYGIIPSNSTDYLYFPILHIKTNHETTGTGMGRMSLSTKEVTWLGANNQFSNMDADTAGGFAFDMPMFYDEVNDIGYRIDKDGYYKKNTPMDSSLVISQYQTLQSFSFNTICNPYVDWDNGVMYFIGDIDGNYNLYSLDVSTGSLTLLTRIVSSLNNPHYWNLTLYRDTIHIVRDDNTNNTKLSTTRYEYDLKTNTLESYNDMFEDFGLYIGGNGYMPQSLTLPMIPADNGIHFFVGYPMYNYGYDGGNGGYKHYLFAPSSGNKTTTAINTTVDIAFDTDDLDIPTINKETIRSDYYNVLMYNSSNGWCYINSSEQCTFLPQGSVASYLLTTYYGELSKSLYHNIKTINGIDYEYFVTGDKILIYDITNNNLISYSNYKNDYGEIVHCDMYNNKLVCQTYTQSEINGDVIIADRLIVEIDATTGDVIKYTSICENPNDVSIVDIGSCAIYDSKYYILFQNRNGNHHEYFIYSYSLTNDAISLEKTVEFNDFSVPMNNSLMIDRVFIVFDSVDGAGYSEDKAFIIDIDTDYTDIIDFPIVPSNSDLVDCTADYAYVMNGDILFLKPAKFWDSQNVYNKASVVISKTPVEIETSNGKILTITKDGDTTYHGSLNVINNGVKVSINDNNSVNSDSPFLIKDLVRDLDIFRVDKSGNGYYSGSLEIGKFKVDKGGNVTLPPGTKISWNDVQGASDILNNAINNVNDSITNTANTIKTEIGQTYVRTNEVEANIASIGGWSVESNCIQSTNDNGATNVLFYSSGEVDVNNNNQRPVLLIRKNNTTNFGIYDSGYILARKLRVENTNGDSSIGKFQFKVNRLEGVMNGIDYTNAFDAADANYNETTGDGSEQEDVDVGDAEVVWNNSESIRNGIQVLDNGATTTSGLFVGCRTGDGGNIAGFSYSNFWVNLAGSAYMRKLVVYNSMHMYCYTKTNKRSAKKIIGFASVGSNSYRLKIGNLSETNAYKCEINFTKSSSGTYVQIRSKKFDITNCSTFERGTVTVNGTSDENVKTIYDYDDRYEDFYMRLKPLLFKYNLNDSYHRKHSGFGARAVEKALTDAGLTNEEFGGVCIQKNVVLGVQGGEDRTFEELYGLNYNEFIGLNTYMIQKLYRKIEELERKINEAGI